MATTTTAWLYVRGDQSVRIVMDGGSLAVHGPGDLFRHHAYDDSATAMLEHWCRSLPTRWRPTIGTDQRAGLFCAGI